MKNNTNKQLRTRSHLLFFPAAAIHAALLLPVSMANLLGMWSWPAGLSGGHGREMLFGLVLALIAGYLLGPQPRWRLYTVFALWLAARIAAVSVPGSLVGALFNLAFVLMAAWLIVPKLLAAKKWRNRSIAPLVLVLILLPIGYRLVTYWQWPGRDSILLFGIMLLSLLMLFMGGRIIAAAAGGEIHRRGGHLHARVQPFLEAAQIILVASGAVVSLIYPWRPATGGLLLIAGVVTAVRMLRWRLWLCRRLDLFALGIGYCWLVVGLVALGLALLSGTAYGNAIHFITIGGLGTLSITIAARVHLSDLKQTSTVDGFFIAATVLIALATLLRLLALQMPAFPFTTLWLATGAWSLAYLLLFGLMIDGARLGIHHH